ncbi:hypothetical protein IFT69_15525 [Pseudomonas putida]|nr:hypothetical protein [Pseudomonas putida]
MKPPFPFPFGGKSKADFSDPLKDFLRALSAEDILKPRVVAELDQIHSSLMAMADDPVHASSAIALEARLVDELHHIGTGKTQAKLGVVVFMLKRYHYLDYPVAARSSDTLEKACGGEVTPEKTALGDLSLATARKLINDRDWEVEKLYLQWDIDVRHPMFDKALPIAVYLVDPSLLGIHQTDHERYFALRHTESAPKWKKLCTQAQELLRSNDIHYTPYVDRITDILGRHDWVRPRETQLALSMMNHKFNYAEVIEGWPEKPEMLEKLGQKLLTYSNKQPWLAPYALLMTHLCHSMDLKGGHQSISNLLTAILLPQNLHREDAGPALKTLSSLMGRLDPAGERLLSLATQMSKLEPTSKIYYQALREEGLGDHAYRHLKSLCKVRNSKEADSAKLIRLMKETGIDQYHRVPSKVRDHAMSIDLGL